MSLNTELYNGSSNADTLVWWTTHLNNLKRQYTVVKKKCAPRAKK